MKKGRHFMLLNFTAKNYKSFADEMCFSMVAAPKQNDLKYSLFEGKAGGQDYKVQCSSVVYGANASGKSNIISAMDTFRAIILRGNIKDPDTSLGANWAADHLDYIPNKDRYNNQPIDLTIEFVEGELQFKYSLSIYVGNFLFGVLTRKIISEKLFINDKLVFDRSEKIKIGEINKNIRQYFLISQNTIDKMEYLSNSSLNYEELFLTNGFKVIFSPELVKIFTDWIYNKFIVIYRADSLEVVGNSSDIDNKEKYIRETISEAANIFGIRSNALKYIENGVNPKPRLCSLFFELNDGKAKAMIPSDTFESYGTLRFINLFPLVLKAFDIGGTLVVDEFDASIHPSALMNIINMFHNDSINKNHAQLIFNTHNPIFLNSNLFRRDEIKFVQRDHDTGNSEVYSLSDFGTSGKNGVRNSTDYMKWYLNYNYGAIEDVDFTPIFENIVNNDDTENKGGE